MIGCPNIPLFFNFCDFVTFIKADFTGDFADIDIIKNCSLQVQFTSGLSLKFVNSWTNLTQHIVTQALNLRLIHLLHQLYNTH